MKYNVDYFIKKFEAIPENRWRTGRLADEKGKRCARGHCYPNDEKTIKGLLIGCPELNKEDSALIKLFNTHLGLGVWNINNLKIGAYQQSTPKQRILAALHDIKKMQQPEVIPERIKTVYVSVPVSIVEQAKELIQS